MKKLKQLAKKEERMAAYALRYQKRCRQRCPVGTTPPKRATHPKVCVGFASLCGAYCGVPARKGNP